MKKNILNFLLLFLLIGCTLESKFGLPNDEKINAKLIGEWYYEKSNDEKIIVSKEDEKTYKLILKDKEKTEELISYSKTIEGYEIMNVKTVNDKEVTNTFYGFKVKRNTLFFSEVNRKLSTKEFKSEKELLDFFKNNIKKKDFFTDKTKLKRK